MTEYSNYPRSGPDSTRPRPPGIYFDTIGVAFRMISADWATWVSASLICVFIALFLGIPTFLVGNKLSYGTWLALDAEPTVRSMIVNFLVGLLPGAIYQGLNVGMSTMAIEQSKGRPISPGMVFLGWRNPFHLFCTSAIVVAMTYIGVICCIVPGLFVIGLMAFANLLPSLQGVDGAEAIRRSFNALKPFALSMFALYFVAGLASGLGVFACVVGILFTAPVLSIVIGLHYTYFFPDGTGDYLYQPISEAPPA